MIGTRLGPYEITAKLGEGGMGEVWRATDSRLKREVAIKVLPPEFTSDRERLARFEREAQLLACLNQPNIAAIYGLEESGGTRALVMELVEGEDLSARIPRGPIPLDDALPIARQIAEALEVAHEQGIVHRDLKPANVKLRPDGVVKVLDFGLAKALEPESAPPPSTGSTLANSPTLTGAGTRLGTILGTAAYMAPEQAKGRAVDKRADIWAFGVVLFEMLGGRPLFSGEDASEVLASVLRQQVPWTVLPAATPPRLRRLLERCLDRDPKQRLRDIGEARVELARLESAMPEDWSAAKPRRERLLWAGLLAMALFSAGLVLRDRLNRVPALAPRHAVRLAFLPPDGVTADEGTYDAAVISPDGRMLVFTGRAAGEQRRLWLRALDSMEARALPDTEDAIEPFWSPDSRAIGFGAAGKLKRIEVAGGTAQVLADAARLTGGAWSREGVIVYSPDFNSGLYRIAAKGGERQLLRRPDLAKDEVGFSNPGFLPDGRRYYFRVGSTGGRWSYRAGALDAAEARPLIDDVSTAIFAAPHWLLFARNEALSAQRLDPETLAPQGEPVLITGGLQTGTGFNAIRYSASDNGVLVLRQPREHLYRPVWYDRSGARLGTVGAVNRVGSSPATPVLSRDGRRVAIQRADSARNQDIWVIDLERGVETRITTDPAFDQLPVWAPDGASVYFSRRGLMRASARGGGEVRLTETTDFARDISPDGKVLIFGLRGETTRSDIWALRLDGDRKPFPLVAEPFSEYEPRVSPDGRWLAYNSDVTGREEIYVRPISTDWKLGEPTQVSTQGGRHARWRQDGRELYYVWAPTTMLEARMMAVPVRGEGATFEAGAPVELFGAAMFPNAVSGEYDVTADGKRFLIGTVEGVVSPSSVSLVFDWDAGLPR